MAGTLPGLSTRIPGGRQQVPVVKPRVTEPRKYYSLPPVSYSNLKSDVSIPELAALLKKCHSTYLAGGSEPKQAFFAHWQGSPDGLVHLSRVVEKSSFIAAAYLRDTGALYTEEELQVLEEDEQGGGRGEGKDGAVWWWWSSGRPRPSKRLVGFVRASGDSSLACIIYDLVVHPQLQGLGLGRRLLRNVVQQISNAGIYDVGLVGPRELELYFGRNSFQLDAEGAVPMVYLRTHPPTIEGIDSYLRGNTSLKSILQNTLDHPETCLT